MTREDAIEKIELVKDQPKKWLFGIDRAIDTLVMAMFTRIPYTARGRKELGQAHALLRDVPGVGKTDLIRSLSFAIGGSSQLIAGNPDIMPRDVLGSEIFVAALGKFFLRKGPVFSNVLLFDEINRTPPKTQSVTLQAMEERIAVLDETDVARGEYRKKEFPLLPIGDDPDEKRLFFWFLATANPVEQEGTYELPEAQLDRFTFSFRIGYPPREKEKEIRAASVLRPSISQIVTLEEALQISECIERETETCGRKARRANEYLMRLIENSRPKSKNRRWASEELRRFIDEYVALGMSPRSNFHFEAAARTRAFLNGNRFITVDDAKEVAPLVMCHRLQLTGAARGAKIAAEDAVRMICEHTEAP